MLPTNNLQIIDIDIWKYVLQINCMSNGFNWIIFWYLDFIEPIDTKKTCNLPIPFNFLHLFQRPQRLSLIKIFVPSGKPNSVGFSRIQRFEVFLDTKNLKTVFPVAKFNNNPVVIFQTRICLNILSLNMYSKFTKNLGNISFQ